MSRGRAQTTTSTGCSRLPGFLAALLLSLSACAPDMAPVVEASGGADASTPSADAPAIHWPVQAGVSTFITQSATTSEQPYPCGSGVNSQHLLPDNPNGAPDDYEQSLDIIVRPMSGERVAADGRGTDVVAVAPGRVIAVNYSQNECDRPFGAGNYVIIQHDDILVDGKPLLSAYMHLNSTDEVQDAAACEANPAPTAASSFTPPEVGTMVAAGTKIGELGNTGNSTGPHLHFQFATDCTLEPADAVSCRALSVLDVNPSGFEDVDIERDATCPNLGAGGPVGAASADSYLSDGSYVTATAPDRVASRE